MKIITLLFLAASARAYTIQGNLTVTGPSLIVGATGLVATTGGVGLGTAIPTHQLDVEAVTGQTDGYANASAGLCIAGSCITSWSGTIGTTGATGATGPTGPTGSTGATGPAGVGTVNTGSAGQFGYYSSAGQIISPAPFVTDVSTGVAITTTTTISAPMQHGAAGAIPGIGFSSFTWITTSETWTAPVNTYLIYVQCWGGGASGSGDAITSNGGGGGGGYASIVISTSISGASYAITISTGANGAAGGATGSNPNPTIFAFGSTINGATSITCSGAKTSPDSASGGAGGTCTGGTYNQSGQAGGDAAATLGGLGGAAPFGGGVASGAVAGLASQAGIFPGGGSGGQLSSGASSAGAAGACLIWY